jgi:uncharacterized protein with HEPN domain
MRPESRRLLSDMPTAGSAVERFTHGKTLDDLRGDDVLRSAIYFKFAVIGKALAQLSRDDEQTAKRISESARIIGFRNQIIHGYARIDDEITWRIIEQKLPILLNELRALLAE